MWVEAGLKVELDGLPKDEKGISYIHRDDLRKISEEIVGNLEIKTLQVGEFESETDRDLLEQEALDRLIKGWAEKSSFEKLEKQAFEAHTCNGSDLTPDQGLRILKMSRNEVG